MRKVTFQDDKRCYDCGEYDDGILFGNRNRLICFSCLNTTFILEFHKCIECGIEKLCTIHGTRNEHTKDCPIYICINCMEKAKHFTW